MLLNQVNPIQSVFTFLSRILVNNRMVSERASYLIAPIVFAVLVYVLLFWFAGPGLRLEGGRSAGRRWVGLGRRFGFAAGAGVLVMLLSGAALGAQAPAGSGASSDESLSIDIDADYRIVIVGDACADLDERLHRALLENLFPKLGAVTSAAELSTAQ